MGKINGTPKANKLTVTEGIADVITKISSHVHGGGKDFYFIPYWFEATEDPLVFIAHHLDGKLPDELLITLENLRQ